MRSDPERATVPSSTTLTSSCNITACGDRSADVQARRIDDCHSRQHQLLGALLTIGCLDLRKLDFVVDTGAPRAHVRELRHDTEFSLGGDRSHIGEVKTRPARCRSSRLRAISSEASPERQ